MSNVIQLSKPVERVALVEERPVVKADINEGYYKVANTIGFALCKVSLSDRESRLLSAVMVKTFGWNKSLDWICNEQLSELTNIAVSNISKVKSSLLSRNILVKQGNKIGVNTVVSQWDKKSEPTFIKSEPTNRKSEPTSEIVSSDPHKSKDTITKDNTNICSQDSPNSSGLPKKKKSRKSHVTKPEAFKQFYALYPANKKGGTDSTSWAKFKSLKLTHQDAIDMLNWLKAKRSVDGSYLTTPNQPFALGITRFITEKTWLTPIKSVAKSSFDAAETIVREEDEFIPSMLPGMQDCDAEVTQ